MIRKLLKYFRTLHYLHEMEKERDYYLKNSTEHLVLYRATERAYRSAINRYKEILVEIWKR